MARRNALQRLKWCSPEQIEQIARHVGFNTSDFPPDASNETRAELLYEWSTSVRGTGLLSLEAAIPWSIEPEMTRQFEVQETAGSVRASSSASSSSAPAVTVMRMSEAPATNAPQSISESTPSPVTSEPRKPTIWEGSTFSEPYVPQPRSEAPPAERTSPPSWNIAERPLPQSSSQPDDTLSRDEDPPGDSFSPRMKLQEDSSDKLSPEAPTARSVRPETPHGLPAYGERAETETSRPEENRTNSGSTGDQSRSGKWWQKFIGKGRN